MLEWEQKPLGHAHDDFQGKSFAPLDQEYQTLRSYSSMLFPRPLSQQQQLIPSLPDLCFGFDSPKITHAFGAQTLGHRYLFSLSQPQDCSD